MLLTLGHESSNDVPSKWLAFIMWNFKYWGYLCMLNNQLSNLDGIEGHDCVEKYFFIDQYSFGELKQLVWLTLHAGGSLGARAPPSRKVIFFYRRMLD